MLKRILELEHISDNKYKSETINNKTLKRNLELEHIPNKKHKSQNTNIRLYQPYVYQYGAFNYGTKMGLILGSKIIKDVKNNGIPYILIFLNDDYPNNIFDYCQYLVINDKNKSEFHLQNDRELFFKYYDNFTKGFYQYFFEYLKANLNNYHGIQKWITDLNYYN